jgi:hypothetical protein
MRLSHTLRADAALHDARSASHLVLVPLRSVSLIASQFGRLLHLLHFLGRPPGHPAEHQGNQDDCAVYGVDPERRDFG